jgi:uncharacterized protein
MAQPLMPKATAVWLVENTTLTFKQIADFVGLHELEVQAIADGEVAPGMHGIDPVASGQIRAEDLERCQADPSAKLTMAKTDIPMPRARARGARYTPVAKRMEKPDAIDWLLKTYPELTDAQVGKLLGTTKATIVAVRDRTHWNSQNIRPRSPVELGFCSLSELDAEIIRARRANQRAEERKQREERRAAREAERKAEAEEAARAAAAGEAAPAEEPQDAPSDEQSTGEEPAREETNGQGSGQP